MSMNILFTYGNNPVSAIIRRLTKEPVSHVAIELDGYVIHCALNGTQIVTKKHFLSTHTVLYSIPATRYKLSSVLGMLEADSSYDFPGLLYLGLRYMLKTYLGWSIPKANLWQISGMTICTEFVTKIVYEKTDSLITPYGLYKKMYAELYNS